MNNNHKSYRLYKALIALEIIAILMVVGWHALRPKNNTNNGVYVAECSATAASSNSPFQLPTGWSWYKIKDIGLEYAYPKNWTLPTTLTNSGSKNYEASFTVTTGANTTVTLSPDCTEFKSTLSDINSGKYDSDNSKSTTKVIKNDQSTYSALTHWTSDSGNQYKLLTSAVVSVGNIRAVSASYTIATGSVTCPADQLASNDQSKCITVSISDEIDKVINSLQKLSSKSEN